MKICKTLMMVFGTLFFWAFFWRCMVNWDALIWQLGEMRVLVWDFLTKKNDTSSIPRTEAFEAVHSLEAKRWADSYIIGLLFWEWEVLGIFCWDGKRSSYFHKRKSKLTLHLAVFFLRVSIGRNVTFCTAMNQRLGSISDPVVFFIEPVRLLSRGLWPGPFGE